MVGINNKWQILRLLDRWRSPLHCCWREPSVGQITFGGMDLSNIWFLWDAKISCRSPVARPAQGSHERLAPFAQAKPHGSCVVRAIMPSRSKTNGIKHHLPDLPTSQGTIRLASSIVIPCFNKSYTRGSYGKEPLCQNNAEREREKEASSRRAQSHT